MHPILLKIGPITFGSYGVAVLLAAFVAWLLIPRYARRSGLDPVSVRELMIWVFVCGSLGCRLANLILRLDEVIRDPRAALWLLQQAGVWYGALIGGLLAGVVLARRFRLPFWRTLDAVAVPVVVGGGLGRIGCLLSGCCYGTACTLPWAITYTDPVAHRLHPDLPWTPVHPAPLYELAGALAIGLALEIHGRRPRPAGRIALLWIIAYGSLRFVIELFRGDRIRGTLLGPLTTSQTIALASILAAAVLLAVRERGRARVPEPRTGRA